MASKIIERANVPNLRFPSFVENWEELSLNDAILMSSGGTPSMQRPEYWGGDIPFISASTMHDTFISNSHQHITKEGLKSGSRLLKKGNLLLLVRGSMLWKQIPICFNKVDVAFNQDVKGIVAGEKTTSLFLLYWFKSKDAILKDMVTSTGIGAGKFDSSSLLSLSLLIPDKSEQAKISKILSLIDERIQTQNKIIEDLELLKRTISNRIFEQKLRFKNGGSHEYPAWKIKNLEEVCEVVGGGTPETSKSEYWNGDIQWFTPTEIKTNYVEKSTRTITDLGLKSSSAKLLPKGTILLTTRATVGEVAIALAECSTNQGFQSLVAKEGVNNVFIFNWLKEHKHELVKRANGSTFAEVSKSEIEKIPISIPSFSEQIKISSCISSIDDKVEIERILLRKWQQQKKILLKKMFI